MSSGHDKAREERDSEVIRVLSHVFFLNLFVAILKLVFGFFAGAVSMLADGLHSLLDSASNVVGYVGMSVARQKPDDDHPYGHRKFEALASVGISMFLFFTAWEVLREVISRVREGHEVDPRPETYAVMVITVIINILVTRYEKRKGTELRSSILQADAKHTQSDVFVSLSVIASLIAASFQQPLFDLIVALLIVGFIIYSGYEIVSGAFSILADTQMVDPSEVIAIALQADQVSHAHRVRSRGGPDDIHVDLHIHVPPSMTTLEAHD
ncbi:MAG: cation transporter, partial [Candidatus Eisenbacteria bacterium]|nr:cation transporter [Candidatus Eisenbacteria bacterium]